eukprot:m.418018 g.418018  ORF g.418018 m.418018 type:complete len:80 (+) comp21288_c0_seq50:1849-2088(+)
MRRRGHENVTFRQAGTRKSDTSSSKDHQRHARSRKLDAVTQHNHGEIFRTRGQHSVYAQATVFAVTRYDNECTEISPTT